MRIIVLIISFFVINYSGSRTQPNFEEAYSKLVYWGVGVAFDTSAFCTQWGWKISQILPVQSTTRSELLLFSELLTRATKPVFEQMKKPRKKNSNTPSETSWQRNKELLSMIASSSKDWELLYFLQERWLAKVAGVYSLAVNWVYPCFGKFVQINPITNHSYARMLSTNLSNAYIRRRECWKQSLSYDYPLILTRPADIREYLPPVIESLPGESLPSFVNRIENQLKNGCGRVILDATNFAFPLCMLKDLRRDLKERLICIQRLNQKTIGGLQILPLPGQSFKRLGEHHQFLIDWMSCFGLAANRVELDRWPLCALQEPFKPLLLHKSEILPTLFAGANVLEKRPWWQTDELFQRDHSLYASLAFEPHHKTFSEQDLLKYKERLETYEQEWQNITPDQSILVKGTFQIFKGLFQELNVELWRKLTPSKQELVQLALQKIFLQWDFLNQFRGTLSLFDLATELEQIHSDLSALLEIFSPFRSDEFHPIYLHCLTIPPLLKSLTTCCLHSSAMTSLAGILKAVQKTVDRAPRIIYGENTYFECINAVKKIAVSIPMERAKDDDLEQVDLLLAQFNPVLKLGSHSGYIVENIAVMVERTLRAKKGDPVTLALDCTIDFLDSPKVAQLLQQFEKEIEQGNLNVVAYRSGNKFDLFGMDNYSGAPLFMIHNRESKWHFFNSLLTDPVLQADHLSLQWFCLAYQYVAPQLELYRKTIFENTRAVLDKLPKRLSGHTGNYRVNPFDKAAEAAFIDIQVFGPFHKMKAPALVAGSLWLKSIEQGTIIFDRPSLGFYHPNLTVIFEKNSSTIRLTLGLDPAQIDIFVDCLTKINLLNGID